MVKIQKVGVGVGVESGPNYWEGDLVQTKEPTVLMFQKTKDLWKFSSFK